MASGFGIARGIRDARFRARDSHAEDHAQVLAPVPTCIGMLECTSRRRIPKPESRIPEMIAFLRGRVLDKQPNRVIVDVGGVGYDVHVPLSTFYEVGDEGAEISLRVYTHVREDTLQLYGFLTDLERQVFERLIGISGHRSEAGNRGIVGHGQPRSDRRRSSVPTWLD